MRLFETVYENYQATVASGERVSSSVSSPDVLAVRRGIPALFMELVSDLGRDPSAFKSYGGVGQQNYHYAKIPWVVLCDRAVTSSTQRGHFIVLLFKEDMSGCYLSLNQGYTQYRDRFGSDRVATRRIELTARDAARFLGVSPPYIAGPVDLASTGSMGKGYERGAVASKLYQRGTLVTIDELKGDLVALLKLHDRLSARVGESILNYLPGQAEEEYQEAVSSLAKGGKEPELPSGPQAPPPLMLGAGGGSYKRNPKVAAAAIKASGFRCQAEPSHQSFTAKTTGRAFVEAHHLIPMGKQAEYAHSLDVPENVVALCPNCHRMLHLGLAKDKAPVLELLLNARSAGLASRGLQIVLSDLRAHYRSSLQDGD